MSLLTDLISVWEMDEASGGALDAHGSINLNQRFTVGAASGVIAGCRTFDGTAFFSVASPAELTLGDVDFTIAQWVNIASKTPAATSLAKWNTSAKRGYRITYGSSSDRFRFEVSNDGSSQVSATANTFGAPSVSTWYFVVAYHNAATNEIGISINNGAFDTTSHSTGVFTSDAEFRLADIFGATSRWNGLLDQTAVWSRILTSGELTDLYNGGSGLAYSSWGGGPSSGSGTVSAVGTLTGAGSTVKSGGGNVSSVGALVGAGQQVASGSGDVDAVGTLAGTGFAPVVGPASGFGTIGAVGTLTGAGSAVKSGSGDIDAVGVVVGAGFAPIVGGASGAGVVTAVGGVVGAGQAIYSGSGSVSAVGAIVGAGSTMRSGSGDVDATGDLVGVGPTTAGAVSQSVFYYYWMR
jgi:hypothetical protein